MILLHSSHYVVKSGSIQFRKHKIHLLSWQVFRRSINVIFYMIYVFFKYAYVNSLLYDNTCFAKYKPEHRVIYHRIQCLICTPFNSSHLHVKDTDNGLAVAVQCRRHNHCNNHVYGCMRRHLYVWDWAFQWRFIILHICWRPKLGVGWGASFTIDN